jgi:hypothetical protein
MHSPHSTRLVAMGKRPLYQLTALLQQLPAVVAFDAPPIRVHCFLLIGLAIPIAQRSFRLRYVAACLGLFDRQYRLIAGRDRTRARRLTGGGLPCPPFRLRDGISFPPWPRFPRPPNNPGRPDFPGPV